MGHFGKSCYNDSVRLTAASAGTLVGQHRADVCVIGGGITGCSTALHLAQRGYRVIVLEAREIGWGASGRSGGHITPGLGTGMGTVAAGVGADAAREIWAMTREAVDLTAELVDRYHIPCDLKWGYVHAAVKPRHMRGFRQWQEEMARDYDYDGLSLLDRDALRRHVVTDGYVGGVYEAGGGHLHPLNYTLGLAQAAVDEGAVIHTASPVLRVESGSRPRVHLEQGRVDADHVVIACNAYLNELQPTLRSKIMPVGNYIIATEPLSDEQVDGTLPRDDAVADANFVLDYYRLSADRRLVYGGQVSYSGREPRGLRQRMIEKMARLFPVLRGVRIDYIWGGWVAITINRCPHFGRLDDNIWFAHGYSGQGMAMAGLAGKLITEAIDGEPERFDLFAGLRHRDFPGGRLLRTPLLVLATNFYRMRDLV